jgi:hypothetical protein
MRIVAPSSLTVVLRIENCDIRGGLAAFRMPEVSADDPALVRSVRTSSIL